MESGATAFSSSGAEALERETDPSAEEAIPTLQQIWNATHRKVCIGWIRQNGYKRICLQFPDNYLRHSNAISDNLKSLLAAAGNTMDTKIFVLADTSYGSCCVDEIAAAHVEADSIIHFGNACRSKVSRLPVLFMYPVLPIDINKLIQKIADTLKDKVQTNPLCIYLDIGYHHVLDQHVFEADEDLFNCKLKAALFIKEVYAQVYPPAEDLNAEREQNIERICVFVGADNARFSSLSLTTQASQWYIYDANANTLTERNPLTAQYIRRRYYYIEKCKDAQTLGLIVATLTADGYLEVVSHLQEMAKARGMKTQIISVGRINPAKLANFLEIDCFVLIGCPFNNMHNSKEFYKPIVSVFEAEMALNPAWHMKYPETYVSDFKQLLPEGARFLKFNPADISKEDVSLVSGRVRGAGVENDAEAADVGALSEQQQALLMQGKMEVMTSDTGLSFEDRTWKGLDPALGCTEPAKLQKGLSGIPIEYTHDAPTS